MENKIDSGVSCIYKLVDDKFVAVTTIAEGEQLNLGGEYPFVKVQSGNGVGKSIAILAHPDKVSAYVDRMRASNVFVVCEDPIEHTVSLVHSNYADILTMVDALIMGTTITMQNGYNTFVLKTGHVVHAVFNYNRLIDVDISYDDNIDYPVEEIKQLLRDGWPLNKSLVKTARRRHLFKMQKACKERNNDKYRDIAFEILENTLVSIRAIKATLELVRSYTPTTCWQEVFIGAIAVHIEQYGGTVDDYVLIQQGVEKQFLFTTDGYCVDLTDDRKTYLRLVERYRYNISTPGN